MSFRRNLPLFCAFLLALIMAACVDEIGFPNQLEQTLLVVDGKLTDSEEAQFLRLTLTERVGRSDNFSPVQGASITLEDDLGNQSLYLETQEPGVYQLVPSGIESGMPGRTYRLRIVLPDGARYFSKPEAMPEPLAADSTTVTFDGLGLASVYQHFRVPDLAEGPYLRFTAFRVYRVGEIFCGSLDPTLACYVTELPVKDRVYLLDANALEDGQPVRQFIQSYEVNRTFGEPQYFQVAVENMSHGAFDYWEKIGALLDQQGSIFDAPPGTVRGNIFREGDPDEVVLGYFYVAPTDTTRRKRIGSDFLPLEINPYCGVPGFPPIPFLPECCNCTRLPLSTLEQPYYWE